MNAPTIDQDLATIANIAFAHGSATRTDLLTAAVTARAPSSVIDTILGLPECCYRDIDHLRSVVNGAR